MVRRRVAKTKAGSWRVPAADHPIIPPLLGREAILEYWEGVSQTEEDRFGFEILAEFLNEHCLGGAGPLV